MAYEWRTIALDKIPKIAQRESFKADAEDACACFDVAFGNAEAKVTVCSDPNTATKKRNAIMRFIASKDFLADKITCLARENRVFVVRKDC